MRRHPLRSLTLERLGTGIQRGFYKTLKALLRLPFRHIDLSGSTLAFTPDHPDNVQGRKFPPIGTCIYCGSDGGADGLRDEHIIPYSLGGNAILQKASCRACEAITSYLDGYLARNIYYDFRLHAGVQSRRKQPTKRPVTIVAGPETKTIEIDLTHHPHFLNLPVWSRPTLMFAEQPSSLFTDFGTVTFFDVPPSAASMLRLPPDTDTQILNQYSINVETFARGIAKIAYCSAISILGLGNFRPLLTPAMILGRYPFLSHFVGSNPEFAATRAEDHKRHMIEFGLYELERLRLVFMTVRLFADCGTKSHGMPVYEVLVGAPKAASLPILEGAVRPKLP